MVHDPEGKKGLCKHTRVVLPSPSDFRLALYFIHSMAFWDILQDSVRIIQIVEPSSAEQQEQAARLRQSLSRWGRKLVQIKPGQAIPPPEQHVLYLQWFNSLNDVPLMPDYWTMVFAQDFLSGLPTRLVQRDENGQLHEAVVSVAPHDPNEFALGIRALPLDQSPYDPADKRVKGMKGHQLAMVPTELAKVSRRLAEIVAGRSNLSALATPAESSAVDLKLRYLIVERKNRPRRRQERRRTDIDLGAAESMGGMALLVEPTTQDLAGPVNYPQARTPGKSGKAHFMDRPGHWNLVAPVDLKTFQRGAERISRVASHSHTIREFMVGMGFDGIFEVVVSKDPDAKKCKSMIDMQLNGKPYEVLGLEAPPFSMAKHGELVTKRQQRERAAKRGEQQDAKSLIEAMDAEAFEHRLIPHVGHVTAQQQRILQRQEVEDEVLIDQQFMESKLLESAGRLQLLVSIVGYLTLAQLVYYFSSPPTTDHDSTQATS